MICVIAVNHNHFEHWCREVNLNPKDNTSVRYIYSSSNLYGLIGSKNIEIVMLPEWYLDKRVEERDALTEMVKEHWKRRKESSND